MTIIDVLITDDKRFRRLFQHIDTVLVQMLFLSVFLFPLSVLSASGAGLGKLDVQNDICHPLFPS